MNAGPDRRTWLRWAAVTGGASAVGGCATHETPDAPVRSPLWPAPPELPRYAYEAVLRDARSLQAATDGGRLRDWLTGDPARGGIGKPLAVAAAAGRVYVTDTEARRVFVFDLPRRRVFTFGTRLEGELRKPAGIDVDGRGQVYVVDSTARRLVVYDALGLYLRHIDGSALWTRPTAVAVTADGQRVHVVDTGGVASARHQVTVHDAEGRLVHTLGRRGSAAGEFNLPADATVGRDGQLWVLDAGNFRVQGFDRALQPVAAFGAVGNGLGQFARPRGIAADRDGLLYVADALLCNVQVFRPDGALLLTLGQRATADAPGRYLLPSRVACDETGRVYVVDQYLHKVEVLRRLPEEEARRLQRAG